MKKNLLSIVAFLCATMSWGQEDVTSTYLQNADFEGEYTEQTKPQADRAIYAPSGWTVTLDNMNENDMSILKTSDLASDSFKDFAVNDEITRGAQTYWFRFRWGSNQTLKVSQTIDNLQAGVYRLTADILNYSSNYDYTAMLYAGQYAQTRATVSTVKANNWNTVSCDFYMEADGSIELGFSATNPSAVERIIAFDNFKLYKLGEEPSEKYPVSMTGYIVNPCFDSNIGGWTATTGAKNQARATNKTNGIITGGFFENWNESPYSGTIEQTINNNLPIGRYSLKLAAFRTGGTGNVRVFANNAFTSVTSDEGTYYEVEATVKDGTLRFGIESVDGGANWMGLDNASLLYKGSVDVSVLKETLATLIEKAKTLYDSKMNNEALSTLQEKVEASSSATTVEAIETCITELNAAISAAESSIAVYETLKKAIEKAEAIILSTNVYLTTDKTTYENAINEAQTAYQNGGYTDAQVTEMHKKLWNTDWQSNILLARPFMSTVWGGGVYTNNWSIEADNKENGSGMTAPFVEKWIGDGETLGANAITAALENVTPGYYKVSALVRVRRTNNNTDNHHGITLKANDGPAIDVCDGKACDDGAPFSYDTYSTVCRVEEDGNLTITFDVAADNNISWLSFKNVNYTAVELASESDYTALEQAMNEAKAHTLGFNEGEYAPYNNIAAIKALNKAEKIDKTVDNTKEDITAIISELKSQWVVNKTDVDIINNGDFATTDLISTGWERTNPWGEFQTNATDGGASSGNAYYNQPGSLVYGNLPGYTMPLDAKTGYKLTFKYASWENGSNKEVKASVLNINGNGLAETSFEGNPIVYREPGGLKTAAIKFMTEEAGDYVLTLANNGNTVLTDISIVKVEKVEIPVSITAGTYATRIFPFVPDFGEDADVKVYSCETSNDNNQLDLTEETELKANTPYILYSKTGCEKTLTGWNLATENEYSAGLLVGRFAEETISIGYVLQTQNEKQAFYKVDADNPIMIPAYRAYIKNQKAEEAGVNVLALVLPDHGTTTIEGVAADDAMVNVYNINGILVRKDVKASDALRNLQPGLYIVNGVKKVVK